MKKRLISINPSDGSVVWEGIHADSRSILQSLAAAREALPEWSMRPLEERVELLKAYAAVLEGRKDSLAETIAREIGKPLREAIAELQSMTGKIDISIKAHTARCAEFRNGPSVTRFKPHGLVAVLGPYNFPGHLPNGHIVPALLAGNTVLFKPSELAPCIAERMKECFLDAGFPPGVIQVIQGGAETAKKLVASPLLDGIFFTGSASTGKGLARQFAGQPGKILALEMGGNNPLIVDSAHLQNLENAVQITVNSAFLSSGQRCTCARRLILIESGESARFLSLLVETVRSLAIGDPFSKPEPFMGPLASPEFPSRILQAQEERIAAGGSLLLKAKQLKKGTGFISPAIMDVTAIKDLPDEEIFGPFLQVIRTPTLEKAVQLSNQTRFGLAAGILTNDSERYRFAWQKLQAGIINWNSQLTGASSSAPFGGIKDSGNHRPAAFFAADFCSYPVASMENPPSPNPADSQISN